MSNLVRLARVGITAIAAVLVLAAGLAAADPLAETRYCGPEIKRDAAGRIERSGVVRRAFRNLYPCPSTGQRRGACPGWNIDHVIPLAAGGCDAVPNMQWLPEEIKRCPLAACKDRWERDVYRIKPEGATP